MHVSISIRTGSTTLRTSRKRLLRATWHRDAEPIIFERGSTKACLLQCEQLDVKVFKAIHGYRPTSFRTATRFKRPSMAPEGNLLCSRLNVLKA